MDLKLLQETYENLTDCNEIFARNDLSDIEDYHAEKLLNFCYVMLKLHGDKFDIRKI